MLVSLSAVMAPMHAPTGRDRPIATPSRIAAPAADHTPPRPMSDSKSQPAKKTNSHREATPSSSRDASKPRQRRKGVLTSERILDAAEARFAERGYAGTSLREVADGVGIRIPSLYNHFPNKASLYAAVLERGITPIFEALDRFVDGTLQVGTGQPGQLGVQGQESAHRHATRHGEAFW